MTDRWVAWVQRPVTATILLALTVLAVLGMAPLAARVERDDDLLAFLPADSPEIIGFREVSDRFGGLDITFVGFETADALDPAFLRKLGALATDLDELEGLDATLSLANVDDFRQDPSGGIVSDRLIQPDDGMTREARWERIRSRPQVAGNLVSADGKSALLLAFHAVGSDPRTVAGGIAAATAKHFEGGSWHLGGSPAIARHIYETTERDLAILSPIAVAVILAIGIASFRSLWATALALGTTSIGVLATFAALGATGTPFTLVLSAMPVILFALGTAYSVHLLSRATSARRDGLSTSDAVARALRESGATVLASGLTTVAGLASLATMDIAPMRVFGLTTALGIGVTLVLALTLVPALLSRFGLDGAPPSGGRGGPTERLAKATIGSPRLVVATLAVVLAVGAYGTTLVDARVDVRAFLAPGSEPARAVQFLETAFGGSQVLQVEVTGDAGEPAVLREIRRLQDALSAVPYATRTDSIVDVVPLLNQAFADVRRVPESREQLGLLYGFVAGRRAVDALVTKDRTSSLMHVRLATNDPDGLDAAVAHAETVARPLAGAYRVTRDPERSRALAVDAIAHRLGNATAVRQVFDEPPTASVAVLSAALAAYLSGPECFVPLPADVAAALADLVVAEVPQTVWGPAIEPYGAPDEVAMAIDSTLPGLRLRYDAEVAADALLAATGGDATQRDIVAGLWLEAADPVLTPDPRGTTVLDVRVTGTPVLYRGLARSVTANMISSLASSLLLVFILEVLFFRSVLRAFIATTPTAVALVVIYGGMGLAGTHLDVGTSMLGSIVIGAGVDFGIHLARAIDDRGGDVFAGVADAAPGIWVNASMVAAGFAVLTLGDAPPLFNIGWLTTGAMFTAALATLAIVPFGWHRLAASTTRA